MIHDLEIQKLKKACPKVSTDIFITLDQLLEQFIASPRAAMMEHLSLEQFSEDPDSLLGPLAHLQIGTFVEHGIGALTGLKGIKKKQVEQLILIFEKLTEGIEELKVSQEDIDKAVAQRARYEEFMHGRHKDLRFLGSIEAERKIQECFARLSEPKASVLQQQKLEEFWDTSLVREPFLEGLTFRELLTMSIDALLKKRSFTNIKIHGLLRCIEAALDTVKGRSNSEVVPGSSENSPKIEPARQATVFSGWLAGQEIANRDFPTRRWLELEWERLSDSPGQLGMLMRIIPSIMSAEEFCRVIDYVFAITTPESETNQPECLKRIRDALEKSHDLSASVSLWKRLLMAPAVSEHELFDPFIDQAISVESQTLVGRAGLVILGAQVPGWEGLCLAKYWTTVPERFQAICEDLAHEENRESRLLRAQSYLPFIDRDTLELLESSISEIALKREKKKKGKA